MAKNREQCVRHGRLEVDDFGDESSIDGGRETSGLTNVKPIP